MMCPKRMSLKKASEVRRASMGWSRMWAGRRVMVVGVVGCLDVIE